MSYRVYYNVISFMVKIGIREKRLGVLGAAISNKAVSGSLIMVIFEQRLERNKGVYQAGICGKCI